MKRFLYTAFIVLNLSFYACSTEIDLTADYKDITVIYGLLDPREDTQWVRIQKAFLGDGDALSYAQISDSLYYDSLIVTLQAYTSSGTATGSPIVLEKILDPFPKDSGIFANDINILYRTTQTLNNTYTYKLQVVKPGKPDTVTSETILCRNFFMTYPLNSSTLISFEDQFGLNQNPSIKVRWTHDDNSRAYQLGFRFNYQEWLASDPSNKELKNFEYYFPMFTVFLDGGGFNVEYYDLSTGQVKYEIFKTDFYNAIITNIEEDPAGTPSGQLRVREFYSLDFIVLQASDELYKYITINQPSLSFVQKVSDYTNITNGVGVFASRSKSGIDGLTLTNQTKDSLRLGQYTGGLNFQ